jgi:hypothetical protein
MEQKKKNHLYNPETTGNTNQVVYTPKSFIKAAERIFTKNGFEIDFAASESNVCVLFFTEEEDSLSIPWSYLTQKNPGWLNPPFRHSKEFLQKCSMESTLDPEFKVITLTQCAASCSYWFENNLVFGNNNMVLIFLEGRIPFEGYGGKNAKTDCVITVWSQKLATLKPDQRVWIWDWRNPSAIPVRPWCQTEDKIEYNGEPDRWVIRKILLNL